jgi:hypothetical protein
LRSGEVKATLLDSYLKLFQRERCASTLCVSVAIALGQVTTQFLNLKSSLFSLDAKFRSLFF